MEPKSLIQIISEQEFLNIVQEPSQLFFAACNDFGNIVQVTDQEADTYFKSRPYESRIACWASDQSKVMNKREDFLKKIDEFKKKYNDKNNLPRPKHWSGWCLNPLSIEFWLGHEFRIHERLKYNKVSNNWKKEILYP